MKKAVDIVLLLPHDTEARAVELSRALVDTSSATVQLDQKNYLPHITLGMGVVDEKDLAAITEKLDKLALQHSAIEVLGTVNQHALPDGGPIMSFDIERSEELQSLHENVMDIINEHAVGEATVDMFKGPNVSDTSPQWVNGYAEHSAHENYKPHVTLGAGRLDGDCAIEPFTASRLALCHLGTYCSCREILFEVELSK